MVFFRFPKEFLERADSLRIKPKRMDKELRELADSPDFGKDIVPLKGFPDQFRYKFNEDIRMVYTLENHPGSIRIVVIDRIASRGSVY